MSQRGDTEIMVSETVNLPNSIESHGLVYEDRFQKIERITAKFDGFSKEYFVSDYGEKAAVLVVRKNQLLLVRQYRLLINRLSYEVPGGKVDNGETPKDAAIRECMEESGIRCSNLKQLVAYDPDLEYSRNHTYVFYTHEAENNSVSDKKNHQWIPVEKCLKMIEKGVINDSLSIISIMAYQLRIRTSK